MFVNRFCFCRRMCGIGISQNARHLYMQNASINLHIRFMRILYTNIQ
jgi:hypothetical protein